MEIRPLKLIAKCYWSRYYMVLCQIFVRVPRDCTGKFSPSVTVELEAANTRKISALLTTQKRACEQAVRCNSIKQKDMTLEWIVFTKCAINYTVVKTPRKPTLQTQVDGSLPGLQRMSKNKLHTMQTSYFKPLQCVV